MGMHATYSQDILRIQIKTFSYEGDDLGTGWRLFEL